MNKKKLFLILLILMFFIIFYTLFIEKKQKYFYYNHDEFNDLKEKIVNDRIQNMFIVNGVKFGGITCFYDSLTSSYLFSINDYNKNNKFDILSSRDIEVAFDYPDDLFQLNIGDNLEIIVYDDKYYFDFFVNFTTLPIIDITSNFKISDYEMLSNNYVNNSVIPEINESLYTDVLFLMSDPNYFIHDELYQDICSLAQLKIRGHDSLRYDKKSYSLKLLKEKNGMIQNNNKSLLGMYEDDNWILDAMYVDRSKIRNKLSSDLWSAIKNINILDSNYVELFVDGEYMGLYNLKEKINNKSLNLSSENVLLKSILYLNDSDINIHYVDDLMYKVKSKYKENNLYIIDNMIQDYYSELFMEHDTDQVIEDVFGIENMAIYKVFIAFIKGVDNNEYNNYYYSLDSTNNKVLKNPWDMDLTFGLKFGNVYNYDEYDEMGFELFYPNSPIMNKAIVQKYFELRKNYLTIENISSYLDYYETLIVDSGAYIRDGNRWYYYDIHKEFDDIKVWCNNRITYLDDLFNDYL